MRIAIVGNSGSGKTTLAERIAERTGATRVELDAIFHQPGWEPKDGELFRREVCAVLDAHDRWVVDGNYDSLVGDVVRSRADTILVMDLPRRTVIRQVVWRTLRRAITREELWNGNREPMTNFYRWDPERNIIRWTWVMHDEYRHRYRRLSESNEWAHAQVVWLHSHRDADRWLDSLPDARPERN